MVKNPLANVRDTGLILGLRRFRMLQLTPYTTATELMLGSPLTRESPCTAMKSQCSPTKSTAKKKKAWLIFTKYLRKDTLVS